MRVASDRVAWRLAVARLHATEPVMQRLALDVDRRTGTRYRYRHRYRNRYRHRDRHRDRDRSLAALSFRY
jgi:hypothetical protein